MRNALQLQLARPLTNEGGDVPLVPGTCIVCSGPGFNRGSTVSGSGELFIEQFSGNGFFNPITFGIVTAVPEPAFDADLGVLLLVGVGPVRRLMPRLGFRGLI